MVAEFTGLEVVDEVMAEVVEVVTPPAEEVIVVVELPPPAADVVVRPAIGGISLVARGCIADVVGATAELWPIADGIPP